MSRPVSHLRPPVATFDIVHTPVFAMKCSSHLFALQSPLSHMTVDPCASSTTRRRVERCALSPNGLQPLSQSCSLTIAWVLEDVSLRPCLPYCSAQRSDTMLFVLLLVHPDLQSKMLDAVTSSTVISLSYHRLAQCQPRFNLGLSSRVSQVSAKRARPLLRKRWEFLHFVKT